MEAHFGHSEQNIRKLLNVKRGQSPLPCRSGGPDAGMAAERLTLLVIVLNQTPRGPDRVSPARLQHHRQERGKNEREKVREDHLGPRNAENALSQAEILPEFLTFAPCPCSSTLDFGPGKQHAIRHLRPASVGVTMIPVLRHPAKKLPQVLIFGVF
jgi:hypothetical protein